MLSEDFRKELIKKMKENPKEAIAELEKQPKILDILLASDEEAQKQAKEKVKYVNMTQSMQSQLAQKSKELRTSQGLLIGAGILLILSLLDK